MKSKESKEIAAAILCLAYSGRGGYMKREKIMELFEYFKKGLHRKSTL